MSDSDQISVPEKSFFFRGISEFDDDDGALEALVQLKELEFGELFTDRETQLDTDENEGIMIRFYHDNEYSALNISTDSESNVKIALNVEGDEINEARSVLLSIQNKIGDIEINSISLFRTFNFPFNSLNLPIDQTTNYDVAGIRIDYEGGRYIIQQNEQDSTSVNASWENPSDSIDESENIGEKYVEKVDNFIGEFQ